MMVLRDAFILALTETPAAICGYCAMVAFFQEQFRVGLESALAFDPASLFREVSP